MSIVKPLPQVSKTIKRLLNAADLHVCTLCRLRSPDGEGIPFTPDGSVKISPHGGTRKIEVLVKIIGKERLAKSSYFPSRR